MFFASEKGATNFWTNRPLEKFGLVMKRREDFQDSVHLRCHLHIKGLPPTCFSIDHAELGGFVNMKHNEVRNLWVNQSRRFFHDVECEPKLLPLLEGEELRLKSANVSR